MDLEIKMVHQIKEQKLVKNIKIEVEVEVEVEVEGVEEVRV
jgi:hypothetical protein